MHNGIYGISGDTIGGQLTPMDADFIDFVNRAAALGCTNFGGLAGIAAVNQFVVDLKNFGLWDLITEMGIFIGDLSTSLVKLKTSAISTLTNTGYVSGDFGANGLTGSSTIFLDTGFSIPTLAINDLHISVYRSAIVSSSAGAIGSSYGATGNTDRFYIEHNGACGYGGTFPTIPNTAMLQLVVSAGPDVYYYSNGVLTAGPVLVGDGRKPGTVLINRAAGVIGNGSTISFWSLGKGMTDTQALNFATLVTQLNRRLGR